jgi:tRNA pseudouridine synthase 9
MSRWLSVAGLTLLVTGSHARLASRADIQTTLAPQLSANASIYFPNEKIFGLATERWSYYHPPNFTVVIEVAEEEDVAKTVSCSRQLTMN